MNEGSALILNDLQLGNFLKTLSSTITTIARITNLNLIFTLFLLHVILQYIPNKLGAVGQWLWLSW